MGRGKRKRRQQEIEEPPLKCGKRVILRRGEGPKAEFNGREVSVLEYPSNGPWMTVGIRGTRMKWKKKHYLEQSPSAAKEDLEKVHLQLNDDLICAIFSFLVGPSHDINIDKELVTILQAKRWHNTLTAVCTRWRKACNNNMDFVFGLLNVNLVRVRPYQVVGHIHWMIKHKVTIGSLNFEAEYGDILFLEKLLNACDTSKLTFVRAHIHEYSMVYDVGDDEYCSCWVSTAYTRYIDRTITLSKIRVRPVNQMSEVLRVPYSSSRPELRQLHDTIALNCKNISALDVNYNDIDMDEPKNDKGIWDCVSKILFSMASVQKLKLHVEFYQGLSINIDWMVENLSNLQELSLSTPTLAADFSRAIRIRSEKLISLNISEVGRFGYIKGDLPNLKTLVHLGPYSGIVPRKLNGRRGDHYIPSIFRAREARIHGVNLPPECKVIRARCRNTGYLVPEGLEERALRAKVS